MHISACSVSFKQGYGTKFMKKYLKKTAVHIRMMTISDIVYS